MLIASFFCSRPAVVAGVAEAVPNGGCWRLSNYQTLNFLAMKWL
jgi:hypothetical protein